MKVKWADISFDGRADKAENLNAIQESLNNMLSTAPGERLFNPQFGCNLEHLLFELCDEATAHFIRVELFNCLSRWDPRIKVNLGLSTVTPLPEELRFNINLVIEVYGVDDNTTFNFSLNSLDQSKVKL